MVNSKLLDALRYKSESTDLDFKSEQYRFVGGNDYEKSELLKDILAMANAWRDGTAYILLGFKDNRPHLAEVVGISESIDDSRLQQFVNGKMKPKLIFHYEEHLYEGKTIGVIAIPKQKRPFFIAHPYGKLKNNIVYVRRGSSTEEAEPTEVAAMALADSARGHVQLELSVLTPDNKPIPEIVVLKYLNFSDKLPDYESPPERLGPLEVSVRNLMWLDNRDFWREYAEYVRVNAALIEMKFILTNRSEMLLSNAKLEVSVKPLEGQSVQMLAGIDLPNKPSSQWSTLSDHSHSLPDILNRRETRFIIDEDGADPICHIRLGSLLPGEEGRSPDTLAIVPTSPGKLQLHVRILAGEITAPQESIQLLETAGESTSLDFAKLGEIYGQDLLAKYQVKADE
ncbi:MAG: ATP-binding protein [Gammaproteobacteria bacterium HGW-Gammaproteobacteria-15]|nr:MAG: ATP-binding protein [Gammaproteobacteria bacterium HGW-Gammaproteobacteria-15]